MQKIQMPKKQHKDPRAMQTILIDFANADYRVNGSVVSLSALCKEDQNEWYPFNPADIVPGVGFSTNHAGPAFTGDALAALVAGASVVIDFDFIDEGLDHYNNVTLDVWKTGTYVPDFHVNAASIDGGDVTRATDFTNEAAWGSTAIGYGSHKLAATVAAGRLAISVDGGTDVTATTGVAPDFAGLQISGNAKTVIRSVKIFSPPQSPLSAL